MGWDLPVKLGVAWTGAPLGGDVLTADQLNNLSNHELPNLFHLLDKAQHGQSVEVESHHVAEDTLNFPPAQPKPATPEPEPPVEPPEMEVQRREASEEVSPAGAKPKRSSRS